MKKHLFLVALAGVALAGCVKNKVESPVTKDVKSVCKGFHAYFYLSLLFCFHHYRWVYACRLTDLPPKGSYGNDCY